MNNEAVTTYGHLWQTCVHAFPPFYTQLVCYLIWKWWNLEGWKEVS